MLGRGRGQGCHVAEVDTCNHTTGPLSQYSVLPIGLPQGSRLSAPPLGSADVEMKVKMTVTVSRKPLNTKLEEVLRITWVSVKGACSTVSRSPLHSGAPVEGTRGNLCLSGIHHGGILGEAVGPSLSQYERFSSV